MGSQHDYDTLAYDPPLKSCMLCQCSLTSTFICKQSIRQWDVMSGLCLRGVKVSEIHPVMALHWDQVISNFSSSI